MYPVRSPRRINRQYAKNYLKKHRPYSPGCPTKKFLELDKGRPLSPLADVTNEPNPRPRAQTNITSRRRHGEIFDIKESESLQVIGQHLSPVARSLNGKIPNKTIRKLVEGRESLHHTVCNRDVVSRDRPIDTEEDCLREGSAYEVLPTLTARFIHIQAARALWCKDGTLCISHIQKVGDDTVLVDLLPVFSNCLRNVDKTLSLGSIVDLLPLVAAIIKSSYGIYVSKGLEFLEALLVSRTELRSTFCQSLPSDLSNTRSLFDIHIHLMALQDDIIRLQQRHDKVGKKAKTVNTLLQELYDLSRAQ